MAKPIATQALVSEVAARIAARGGDPTLIAVQAEIGGGYSTVKKYLEVWKAQQAVSVPLVEVPAAIGEQGVEFVRSLWTAANTLTDQRVTQIRKDADEQVGEARAALDAAEKEIARLETEAEMQTQRHTDAEQMITGLRDELVQARGAEQVASARATELERRVDDLKAELEAANTRAKQLGGAKLADELAAIREQLREQGATIARLGGASTDEDGQ